MKISRRKALATMAGAGLVASGCGPIREAQRRAGRGLAPAVSPPKLDREPMAVAWSRFGYGPRPGDLDATRAKGPEAWFEEQLAAPADDPAAISWAIRSLDITQLAAWDLRDVPIERVIGQMQQAALLRAAHSPWQLRERMVDFWSNHFNVFARKGLAAYRKPRDEREVVRKHVFGKFPDMVLASARSTAMLVYLDQQNSHFVQPNENYARELLELHTLGVYGGYTQRDVMEVARCFTGWTEERGFMRPKGSFKFDPDLHDSGPKVVLGERIPGGGGVEDGERVVEIVCKHPSTAKHLARKLSRFFVGPEAADAVAPKVAQTYQETGGDIAAMLRTLFASGEWAESPAYLKRPYDYVVTAMRALDAQTDGGEGVRKHLAGMSQPLYEWPMPDGYPDETEAWTGTLLGRWRFAQDLAANRLAGTQVDLEDLHRRFGKRAGSWIEAIYHAPAQTERFGELLAVIRGQSLQAAAALCLSAPEFQWR